MSSLLKIQNSTATCFLGRTIDLFFFADVLSADYRPHHFNGAIIKMKDVGTALVFATGNMVIIGPKSKELSLRAAKSIARMIQLAHNEDSSINCFDFKIHNIV